VSMVGTAGCCEGRGGCCVGRECAEMGRECPETGRECPETGCECAEMGWMHIAVTGLPSLSDCAWGLQGPLRMLSPDQLITYGGSGCRNPHILDLSSSCK
jgi:hypothetical protein